MVLARIIMLIVLTAAINLTYLLISALKSLQDHFCGAIVMNVLLRKRHFILNFNK